ncbi:protein FAM210A [Tribolium madens]|uniref:protein FAM210A n=1 Tax=Tribolium madens TaxID=41895 RepID=UPI001CF726AF|nr:protein FAM210A [Tribolium madens]
MANVLARRFFTRNLFKFNELAQMTTLSRCTATVIINFKQNNGTLHPRINQNLLQPFKTTNIQFYSDLGKNKKKPSLFQRFKQMYKDYWYVLVPVHLVTSAAWFGGFYYLAKSGVDIVGILESWNISERIVNPLRDSSMGYVAVAYALYKIATPARYTVTLGGTTISINYLKKWGYIKPVPSKERLKEMYFEQKDNLLETVRETKEGLKDKKENIIEDLDKGIKQIGDKIKGKDTIVDDVKKKTKGSKDKG